MYPTIRMRKTKKRVTAATKLQALVRGKLARRTATAKKQQKQVKGRSAYKSYLSSFTADNTQKLGGFSGLNLLLKLNPQTEKSLKEHGGRGEGAACLRPWVAVSCPTRNNGAAPLWL